MNWIRTGLLGGLLIFLIAAAAAAEPLISPAEIKPGMRGYGLSVFRGAVPERFEVEALGVLRNVFPKRDLIVIRAAHPEVDKAGIIAGMSGSPVWFDGKLAGAVAYSWAFQKEPIGLVTAIGDMLALYADTAPAGRPARPRGRSAEPADGLRPIAAPLAIGGLTPRVFRDAADIFKRYGLLPVQGGSAGGDGGPGPESLVPGAAFGVQLARGDVDFTGIGTVTHREGNQLLGFGHPMFQFADCEYPLVTATILAVNPSYMDSFKIGVAGREVGTITRDHAAGVGGTLGPRARMVPIRTTVRVNGRAKTYAVESIRHPYLLLPIAAMVVSSALEQEAGNGDQVCRFTSTFTFADRPDLVRRDALYAPGTVNIMEMLMPLMLQENPWEELRPTGIAIDAAVEPGRRIAELRGVGTDHLEVRPGERVTVTAWLTPYDSAPQPVALSFVVPTWLEDRQSFGVKFAPASEFVQPPPVFTLDDIFSALRSLGSSDELQATLVLPRSTRYTPGRAYPELPASVSGVLDDPSRVAEEESRPEFIPVRVATPWVISGAQHLRFTVIRD